LIATLNWSTLNIGAL